MRFFLRCAVTSLFVVTSFLACGDSGRGFEPPPSGFDNTQDAATPPPPSCAGRRCSRDLHSVLDGCTDQVIETCQPDQGCGEGACTTPCDAASKAQGSIGCSFYTTPPDTLRADDSSCFAAFVANTWSTPVSLTATFGADTLDISQSVYRATPSTTGGPYSDVSYERIDGPIPPGEVGVVFLSQGDPVPSTNPGSENPVSCPANVTVAYHGTAVDKHDTSIYKAFHLQTDVPVSAYSIFPYGGAKSYVTAATLLLPTTSWGTNYVMLDGLPGLYNLGLPFVQVVAQEDDTVVSIKPRVDIRGGDGVAPGAQNVVGTWTLQRGQVLELAQSLSLDGSPLESNHPVAMFGGTQCSNIPLDLAACDSLHQQIPPLKQWSSSYSAVPYKTRRVPLQGQEALPESVTWSIAAARDGTILTYDPEPSGSDGQTTLPGNGPPDGVPHALTGGQVAFLQSDHPFHVRSQSPDYPIYVANYMTGGQKYYTDGDPDFVNVVPDDQFLDNYVFFVDHTYKTSTLTFVRKKDGSGFHDVKLDCAGVVSGWTPLGTDGTTEYTWVDITRDGKANGTCTSGRHESSSDGPFALYVWGIDYTVSYGFPAGAGSRVTSPYTISVR
jgi:hypothetical protein